MLWELCREQGSGIHGPGGEWPQLQRVAMQILLLSPCFIVSLGENALCFVSLEARIYILFSFFFFFGRCGCFLQRDVCNKNGNNWNVTGE